MSESHQAVVDLINKVLDERGTNAGEGVVVPNPKRKRNLTDEQRQAMSERAKNSAWNKFRREYAEKNPDVKGRELMKAASEAYKLQKESTQE